MNIQMTIEEARTFIQEKIGQNVEVVINNVVSMPVTNYSIQTVDDKFSRDLLIQDMKRALSVDKMFAIRFVRYRLPQLSLTQAKSFVEMDEIHLNNYVITGDYVN